jgi:hypothetical protein
MLALAADENFNNCHRLLYLAQQNLPMPRFRFRRSMDPFEALQPLVSSFFWEPPGPIIAITWIGRGRL